MTQPRLLSAAFILSLSLGCGAPRAAELGIFNLQPEPKSEPHDQPASAGTPQLSAGASATPAKLALELTASAKDFCPAECVDLIAAVSGGRPPYQYTWELGGAGLSGPGPQHVCPSMTATYSVTVIDADFQRSGFEVGDQVQIAMRADCARLPAGGQAAPPIVSTPNTPPTSTPPAAPPPTAPAKPGPLALTLEASAPSVCRGECVALTATATGGRAPYQYNWDSPDLSGPGPHQVCPTKTTTYNAFAMDADFDTNHLEVGAMTRVTVNACSK